MGELVQYSMNDLERMAIAIAKSGLFGMKTPEQALALMLLSQAEGLHPATAARDYHIIQGRPALKADAILARFQQAGGRVEWLEYSDSRVVGRFSHPQGGSVEVDWTLERAKAAGLGGRDMWKNYPRQMLRARVISEGVRTVFPAVLAGMYTPEEVMDMEPTPVIKPAPVSPALESPTPASPPITADKPPSSEKPSGEVVAMIRAMQEQGLGEKDRDLMLAICSNIIGREITSRKDLSNEEAIRIRKIVLAVSAAAAPIANFDFREFWEAYISGVLEGDLSDIPALVADYTEMVAATYGAQP